MEAGQKEAQFAQARALAGAQAQAKYDQGVFEKQYYEYMAVQEEVALGRDLDTAKIESQRTMSASRAIMANQGGGIDTDLLAVTEGSFARQRQELIHDSNTRKNILTTKAGRAMNEANTAANLTLMGMPINSGASSSIFSGLAGSVPGLTSLYKAVK